MVNSTANYYWQAEASQSNSSNAVFTSVLVVVASLLILEQAVYKYKKGHLPVCILFYKKVYH